MARKSTVMVVDDEPDLLKLIKKFLESEGFEVHAFSSPEAAIQHVRQGCATCTIVVSDIRMPGMSGFEFCRRVKEARPEAPVILMTAFEINQSEFSKVMPHTTIDGFIQKPVSLKNLMALINEISPLSK